MSIADLPSVSRLIGHPDPLSSCPSPRTLMTVHFVGHQSHHLSSTHKYAGRKCRGAQRSLRFLSHPAAACPVSCPAHSSTASRWFHPPRSPTVLSWGFPAVSAHYPAMVAVQP